MNRQERRRHGAYTRRWDTARRSPRGFRMRDHAWTTGLSAYVDEHGTPIKSPPQVLSTWRIRRNLVRKIQSGAAIVDEVSDDAFTGSFVVQPAA